MKHSSNKHLSGGKPPAAFIISHEKKKSYEKSVIGINTTRMCVLTYYVVKSSWDWILGITLALNIITNILMLISEVKNND